MEGKRCKFVNEHFLGPGSKGGAKVNWSTDANVKRILLEVLRPAAEKIRLLDMGLVQLVQFAETPTACVQSRSTLSTGGSYWQSWQSMSLLRRVLFVFPNFQSPRP
ncbi:unnamed protein product [Calypogeia fissa]